MKSPKWPVVLGVACAVVVVAAQLGADETNKADETKKLEGTWIAESTSKDAELAMPWKGGQWVFAGDVVRLTLPREKEQTFPFTVDPAKVPKTMDIAPPKNSKQAPWPTIYELDGDSLKLCIGSGDKRPARFTDKDGFIVVLKRKKPAVKIEVTGRLMYLKSLLEAQEGLYRVEVGDSAIYLTFADDAKRAEARQRVGELVTVKGELTLGVLEKRGATRPEGDPVAVAAEIAPAK